MERLTLDLGLAKGCSYILGYVGVWCQFFFLNILPILQFLALCILPKCSILNLLWVLQSRQIEQVMLFISIKHCNFRIGRNLKTLLSGCQHLEHMFFYKY